MNEAFLDRLVSYEQMMRADVPRKRRRKARYPVSTKPPKCDGCGGVRAPGTTHDACAVRP